MAHVITGIPIGSQVYIFAQSRFRHFRFVSTTGALTIISHLEHYPIKVAVRPMTMSRDAHGNLSMGGADSFGRLPGEESRALRAQGGAIDMLIETPDDWYYPGSPRLNESRHGTLISIKEIVHQSTAETNLYQRMPEPAPLPDLGLCLGFTVTESATLSCEAPHLLNLDFCQKHAEERGLVKPLVPTVLAENACVWTGCPKERFLQFVMCAEHAILAGLVSGSPTPLPIPAPTPDLPIPIIPMEATPSPSPSPSSPSSPPPIRRKSSSPMGTYSHKPGCRCRPCSKRRRDTAAIASAHDEVESVAVLSGVDTGVV